MRQAKFLIMVLLLGLGRLAVAQTYAYPGFLNGVSATGTIAVGQQEFIGSLGLKKMWGVAFKRRLQIGLGLRYNHYYGQDRYFETAPAKLTSNQEGPQVLFVETQRGNIDSVRVSRFSAGALNLALHLGFNITERWSVGTNIDLVGVSFGPATDGKFISSYTLPGYNTEVTTKPTSNNLLLISDNDIGSLNSEFFVQYAPNAKWAIQAGLSFYFAELKTDRPLLFDNDRFRRKAVAGLIGVSWYPFRKL